MPTEPPAPRRRRCRRCRPPPKTSAISAEESGVLTVWVPYDAKVTVNGLETKSTGSRRQFVSYGLKPGFSYKYVVRAEVVRNGKIAGGQPDGRIDGGPDHRRGLRFQHHASQQVAAAQ